MQAGLANTDMMWKTADMETAMHSLCNGATPRTSVKFIIPTRHSALPAQHPTSTLTSSSHCQHTLSCSPHCQHPTSPLPCSPHCTLSPDTAPCHHNAQPFPSSTLPQQPPSSIHPVLLTPLQCLATPPPSTLPCPPHGALSLERGTVPWHH